MDVLPGRRELSVIRWCPKGEARLKQDRVLAGRGEYKASRPVVTKVSNKSTAWLVDHVRKCLVARQAGR